MGEKRGVDEACGRDGWLEEIKCISMIGVSVFDRVDGEICINHRRGVLQLA